MSVGRCFRHYIKNVDFKAIKIHYNFFAPVWERGFDFSLKKRWKLRFSRKTFTWEKAVSLTCWAGLMSVGALFSSLHCECGLQGNQDWLDIFCPQCGEVVWLLFEKSLKIRFFAWDLYLRKYSKFDLLGWLNECRGAVFVIILRMWTSRQSRSTINFFAPSVGKGFNFSLKNR